MWSTIKSHWKVNGTPDRSALPEGYEIESSHLRARHCTSPCWPIFSSSEPAACRNVLYLQERGWELLISTCTRLHRLEECYQNWILKYYTGVNHTMNNPCHYLILNKTEKGIYQASPSTSNSQQSILFYELWIIKCFVLFDILPIFQA